MFFGKVILRNGVQPDPQRIKALMEMPTPMIKRSFRLFWLLLII